MTTAALIRPARRIGNNEPCWCNSGQKYKRCHKDVDVSAERKDKALRESKRIKPGVISPMRSVPAHIPRPDYADRPDGRPVKSKAPLIRTPDEIVRMRRAARAAAIVLSKTSELIRPGITTEEIDVFCHELMISMGGYPSTLNYHNYQKSLCTSVNEVICHGIPDSRPLEEGDIINLDVTIYLDGVHGDCNATFPVGSIDETSAKLIECARNSLARGIEAVKPGRPISDIGRAIELYADGSGFSVVRSYCGHGICDVFHTELQIPHYFDARANTVMKPGMTFTIEPMINVGTHEDVLWDDQWTVVTKDLQRSAQFEHTILVNEDGAEILTRADAPEL